MDKTLQELNKIFADVLDSDTIVLTSQTMAKDVEGWDSLTHLEIVVAIEKHFKVKFLSSEILSWQNIGEMLLAIDKKIKA